MLSRVRRQDTANLENSCGPAAIVVGADEDLASTEPELERLRHRFGDRKVVVVALQRARLVIQEARSEPADARKVAGLARALEWSLLEPREQSPAAGRLEAARAGAEAQDVHSHVKKMLKGSRTSDGGRPD